ncbi:MAG: sodium:proton antiporter NhaD [Saprospiraceae bacterium]|nr:sodium:proton antiporter NhaD [Saprospiraceae bacterium]
MFILMVVIFVLGYTAIALEHPLKVDKAVPALLIGVLTWTVFILGGDNILAVFQDFAGYANVHWTEYLHHHPNGDFVDYVVHNQLLEHLGEISEILFFLLGAMTIVEIVDQHQGFKIITDKIKTTNKVKLLWILSFITFFMSAALDNLTTTIVMVALLRKLIDNKNDRWFFASMIILAANAGGAWSPIGDVTTIMLWIKGQVTTIPIIIDVFLPSLVTMIVPLAILSFTMKGTVERPVIVEEDDEPQISKRISIWILCQGVASLLFVPVFKTVTHLPPYLGMLFGLGLLWLVTEIIHKTRHKETESKLTVVGILTRVDVPTVLFFLGILLAVSSLQSAGHLTLLAGWLDSATNQNIYIIDLAIGLLSSIVDNVPLVAGAMGMYDIAPAGAVGNAAMYVQDGQFWQFLAYCAGTGGSILIIGSAAGVAAMGMEKIDFIWYMKKISLLALVGYFAGAAVYWLTFNLL